MKNVYTNKKRKGFTLVELLAVIIVLSVIMIIAIPSILSAVNSAKRTTFIEYVQKVIAAAEQKSVAKLMSASTSSEEICYQYAINSDLDLDETGEFDGWIVYSVELDKYFITIYNDEFMLENYEFESGTGDTEEIDKSVQKYSESQIESDLEKIKKEETRVETAKAEASKSAESGSDTTLVKTSLTDALTSIKLFEEDLPSDDTPEDETPEDSGTETPEDGEEGTTATTKSASKSKTKVNSNYIYALFSYQENGKTEETILDCGIEATSEDLPEDDGSGDTDESEDPRAYFLTGKEVNNVWKKMINSSNTFRNLDYSVVEIRQATTIPDKVKTEKLAISTTKSPVKIYTWALTTSANGQTAGRTPTEVAADIAAADATTAASLLDKTKYIIYWYTESTEIYLPTDMSYMFSNFGSLTTIDGINSGTKISNLHEQSKGITSLAYLFYYDSALTGPLDLTFLDTSNTKSMAYTFALCEKLDSVNISNWNTSNVTTFGGMFSNCKSITSLDISNFSSESAITMQAMFSYCTNVTTINLGTNFHSTSKTTLLSNMFQACEKLNDSINTYLVLFDTSKVTSYAYMFDGCSTITYLDVSKFKMNSEKSLILSYMFANCTNLKYIYASESWSNYLNTSDDETTEMFIHDNELVSYKYESSILYTGWTTSTATVIQKTLGTAHVIEITGANYLYLGYDNNNKSHECFLTPISMKS